jgi:predicted nuclease with TOPRIM domain
MPDNLWEAAKKHFPDMVKNEVLMTPQLSELEIEKQKLTDARKAFEQEKKDFESKKVEIPEPIELPEFKVEAKVNKLEKLKEENPHVNPRIARKRTKKK